MRAGPEQLDGQSFHIRRWGRLDAPLLLLLHGFPEYGGAWDDLAPLFADDFHVIAPDQRGYGQSWAPQDVSAMRLSALVKDMATLLNGQKAIVMGHDWGASVAYGLACARPDLVSHLIIANGVHPVPFQRALVAGGAQTNASQYITKLRAPGFEDHLAKDDFARLMRLFSADMNLDWLTPNRRKAYKTEWSRPGRLRAMINWYRASPLVVPPPDTSASMPQLPEDRLHIPCPHLLVWGDKDTALLPEATDGLEHFAPNLTRVHLPEADHWLIHQSPNEIAAIVKDWLEATVV